VTTNGIHENLSSGQERLSAQPNPFKTTLNIRYKKTGWVNIFNSLGELVRSLYINQYGNWNAKDSKGLTVSPGTYFIRGNESQIKVTLLD